MSWECSLNKPMRGDSREPRTASLERILQLQGFPEMMGNGMLRFWKKLSASGKPSVYKLQHGLLMQSFILNGDGFHPSPK